MVDENLFMKKIFFLCFLLWLGNAHAELQKSDTKESLRGLTGVYVIAQFIDLTPDGMSSNSIVETVSASLRAAGVSVYTEPKRTEGFANLCVTVNTVKEQSTGAYIFMVQIALSQTVHMTRLPSAKPVASLTWMNTIQGLTTPDRVDIIDLAIKQGVNFFIKDFFEGNSPKPNN